LKLELGRPVSRPTSRLSFFVSLIAITPASAQKTFQLWVMNGKNIPPPSAATSSFVSATVNIGAGRNRWRSGELLLRTEHGHLERILEAT